MSKRSKTQILSAVSSFVFQMSTCGCSFPSVIALLKGNVSGRGIDKGYFCCVCNGLSIKGFCSQRCLIIYHTHSVIFLIRAVTTDLLLWIGCLFLTFINNEPIKCQSNWQLPIPRKKKNLKVMLCLFCETSCQKKTMVFNLKWWKIKQCIPLEKLYQVNVIFLIKNTLVDWLYN